MFDSCEGAYSKVLFVKLSYNFYSDFDGLRSNNFVVTETKAPWTQIA